MNESTILVIDDEPGIREGCKRALTKRGFFVATAENGEQGLQIVRSGNFDLVLIDIMMPGTNGIDLISAIHQHDPEIVCVIITGYATVELAIRAIKSGAYDFLTKPFTLDELFLAVDQALERRKLSLEAIRLQTIEAESRRLAEEKARLVELDRAKVAFIRLLTHELKAPVSAISTYLGLILDEYVTPEQQRAILERAQERATEQLLLIADLLEFGRLKDTQSTGKTDRVCLDEILRNVILQIEPQAVEKKIKITTDISAGGAPVCLTTDQAKSLWTNLISNAIKYTPSGGIIKIRLQPANTDILGQVEDNGIGIPAEAKEKLFSEFFRAQNAKALNIPGTGLGLAIVKQIVDKAGGRIWVESEIGNGSTFSFTLPLEKV